MTKTLITTLSEIFKYDPIYSIIFRNDFILAAKQNLPAFRAEYINKLVLSFQ